MSGTIAFETAFESASLLGCAIYHKGKSGFNIDNTLGGAFFGMLPLCIYLKREVNLINLPF